MIRYWVVFSLFLSSFLTIAQTIESISFKGLTKTKEDYLTRFLTINAGEELDSVMMEQNRKRLTNLEMFSHVHAEVTQLENGNVNVGFWCSELYTLLPIFSLGGIKENFFVQAGASEVNLGGRGNKLTGYYQYYDRSSISLSLTIERFKQSNWGSNFNFVKWSTLEPLYFESGSASYEYDNWTYGGVAIRHFNYRDKLEFGGSYFTEEYRKFSNEDIPEAPQQLKKKKILGKARYVIDRVNGFYFYQDGIKNYLNLQTVRSLNSDPFEENPLFVIVFNDFHCYRRVGSRGNLAGRFRMGLSTNNNSPFAPFVLDSYINIRGVGNRVDRGTGAIILNLEYRHSFLDMEKIAVQGVVFTDNGSWRNPGGGLSDFAQKENLILFGGGGVRLIHKKIYNAILRIDYGTNLHKQHSNGFVIGVGQYF